MQGVALVGAFLRLTPFAADNGLGSGGSLALRLGGESYNEFGSGTYISNVNEGDIVTITRSATTNSVSAAVTIRFRITSR